MMIRKIKHFIRLIIYYMVTRILFIVKKHPIVLDSLTSIKTINRKGLSISRYGDGEFMLMIGKSLKFQEYDEALANRLQEILYINDNDFNKDNFAVCIPDIYRYKLTRSLKYDEEIFWLYEIIHFPQIYLNKKLKGKIYLDSCLTRPYIRYKKTDISNALFKGIKKIWNNMDILLIEGEFSRLGVGNNLFENAKSVKRILCPSNNAFKKYDEILEVSKKYGDNKLVLIALGPTATVLAYDLYKNNIRAIDLGHLDLEYEWFLKKSKEKELVKNKIVNEIENKNQMLDIKDDKYNKSIIYQVK